VVRASQKQQAKEREVKETKEQKALRIAEQRKANETA
jgi:hypothetical protein